MHQMHSMHSAQCALCIRCIGSCCSSNLPFALLGFPFLCSKQCNVNALQAPVSLLRCSNIHLISVLYHQISLLFCSDQCNVNVNELKAQFSLLLFSSVPFTLISATFSLLSAIKSFESSSISSLPSQLCPDFHGSEFRTQFYTAADIFFTLPRLDSALHRFKGVQR